MDKGAEFSQDKTHRYRLWRIWNPELPKALCIGLNPSKADSDKDDNTISTLINVLTRLGYGGFYMMNCWSYISTYPKKLQTNPMSDEWNNNLLTTTAAECKDVIFAWGTFKIVRTLKRDEELIKMFPNAKCFGVTKNGSPFHPRAMIYIKGRLENPVLFEFKKQ